MFADVEKFYIQILESRPIHRVFLLRVMSVLLFRSYLLMQNENPLLGTRNASYNPDWKSACF